MELLIWRQSSFGGDLKVRFYKIEKKINITLQDSVVECYSSVFYSRGSDSREGKCVLRDKHERLGHSLRCAETVGHRTPQIQAS